MSRHIDAPQGSDEWRAARCGVATASRFSDVMAKIKSGEAADRRNYRADLVIEQLTGKPLESFQSAAMKQGTEREPLARLAFEEETGMVVKQVGFYLHDEIRAGASPDGLIGTREGLEIKCPERAAHLRYVQADGVPPEYVWQVMGQMWICDLDAVYFVSFNPDYPANLQLIVRRIKRDEVFIKELAAEVGAFMEQVEAEAERLRRIAA